VDEGRDVWSRVRRSPEARVLPNPWRASTCSTCCTRRGRRETEGHRHNVRRLPSRASRRPTSSSSTEGRHVYWCASEIGWVTGHSYIVFARSRTDDRRHVQARRIPDKAAVVDHREVTRSRSFTARRPRSARFIEVGRGISRARHVIAGLSDRSASDQSEVALVPRDVARACPMWTPLD